VTPLLVLAFAAQAAPPATLPGDVVVPGSGGTWINWTTLRLEAEGAATGIGVGSMPATLEQEARAEIGPNLLKRAQDLEVRSGMRVSAILSEPTLGPQVGSQIGLWEVDEARYFASGKVVLRASVSIADVLKPWTVSESVDRGDVLVDAPLVSGVLVDARGVEVTPAFAPRLLDAAGVPVFDGRVWADRATQATITRYVTDPAHPAAAMAGATPMIVVAAGAMGSDLLLTADDAAALRAQGAVDALRGGALVIVVDPP
jgi:hypothetical protein